VEICSLAWGPAVVGESLDASMCADNGHLLTLHCSVKLLLAVLPTCAWGMRDDNGHALAAAASHEQTDKAHSNRSFAHREPCETVNKTNWTRAQAPSTELGHVYTGIKAVKWRDEWNKENAVPFTLYFKAWCPDFIFVVDALLKYSKWEEFVKRTYLRCWSGFDDYMEAKKLPFNKLKKIGIYREFGQAVDKAASIQCERKRTRGEVTVWEANKAAWDEGHDVSCTEESGYANNIMSTPAIVIDGKKYCETEEIIQWLVDNMDKMTVKSSSNRHMMGLTTFVALGLTGGFSG